MYIDGHEQEDVVKYREEFLSGGKGTKSEWSHMTMMAMWQVY